jgi:hypothetical protein
VFFWVLALDHDLRVASDIIGSVFVRNPAGTKVALWEEVALDEGKESHCTELEQLCISTVIKLKRMLLIKKFCLLGYNAV